MNKIVILLISISKIIKLPNMLSFKIKNNNNKIIRFNINNNSKKLAKKLG